MSNLKMLVGALGTGALFAFSTPVLADDKPAAAKPAAKDEKAQDQERVNSFAEMLKKQEPEAYKRFVEVREARDKALEGLKKTQNELKAAVGEEKINLYQEYKIARKKYSESYLNFIGFLDDRDQKRITLIEENVKKLEAAKEQIKTVLETRKKAREELQAEMKKD